VWCTCGGGRGSSSRPTPGPTATPTPGWSRALLEARRNGLGVEELVQTIREVAAEEEAAAPAPQASAANQGTEE
jgi:hypothetical protein